MIHRILNIGMLFIFVTNLTYANNPLVDSTQVKISPSSGRVISQLIAGGGGMLIGSLIGWGIESKADGSIGLSIGATMGTSMGVTIAGNLFRDGKGSYINTTIGSAIGVSAGFIGGTLIGSAFPLIVLPPICATYAYWKFPQKEE